MTQLVTGFDNFLDEVGYVADFLNEIGNKNDSLKNGVND